MYVDMLMRFNPRTSRPPAYVPKPHCPSPLAERNAAIFEARKTGRHLKDIAQEYGLSAGRIRQIVERAIRMEGAKEWRSIPTTLTLTEFRECHRDHLFPRKKGREGRGYSPAATLRQRAALAQWEKIAAEVDDAQYEDAFAPIREWQNAAKERAKIRALEAESVKAYETIRAFKAEWLALGDARYARKAEFADRIDIQLGLLRAMGVEPYEQ